MQLPTNINEPLGRKLRMGLIGGGGNAFIGKVHAVAAALDGRAELVAGALSSVAEKARAMGALFGISADRTHGSYRDLIQSEAARDESDRIDFISIATPNNTHYEIAKLALENGFNVVCEKPMTISLQHARELVALVEKHAAVFVLSHNYSGYPLVRQARDMISEGELGEIQAIRANYIQGGLRGQVPGQAPPRGAWKSDPEQAGPSGTVADIGTHSYQLIRYITRLSPVEVSSHLCTFHPGRKLEDYGHALLRFADGAIAAITVSQVTHGRLNDLSIEIDGTKASIAWRQEDPNQLVIRRYGQPVQIYERHPAAAYASASLRSASRLPAGHPEAFFEAFANLYRDSYDDMAARLMGKSFEPRETSYPNVHDGFAGVLFVEQALASNAARGAWQRLEEPSPYPSPAAKTGGRGEE
jgi:predicted dehydrogenase